MSTAPEFESPPIVQIGRYTLMHQLAAGGMGTVHLAKFHGEAGFSRLLAVKRLHPHFATDPDFLCMFLDEARIASRIRHPHVVSVVDVVSHSGELLLAMEYVQGLPLSRVLRLVGPAGVPTKIAVSITGGILQGLHAAHEAKSDKGEFLNLVHRDVSPQNVMLGQDGAARVVDFGIASAAARLQTTAEGQVKGKLSYMAPEQIAGRPVDRRADVFSVGVVLWEMLTGQRLAAGDIPEKVHFMTEARFKKPSEVRPELPFSLDVVVMKALAKYPSDRYATAEEMLHALYEARAPAHLHEVCAWLDQAARPLLIAQGEQAAAAEAMELPRPATVLTTVREPARILNPDPPTTPARSARVDEPDDAAAPRSRIWTIALVALLALVGLGLILWVAQDEAPIQATPGSGEIASPGPPASDEKVDATSPGSTANLPSPELPAAAPSPAPAAPSAPKQVTGAPKKAKSDPCSPPYVLLKGGLKRYKPECL